MFLRGEKIGGVNKGWKRRKALTYFILCKWLSTEKLMLPLASNNDDTFKALFHKRKISIIRHVTKKNNNFAIMIVFLLRYVIFSREKQVLKCAFHDRINPVARRYHPHGNSLEKELCHIYQKSIEDLAKREMPIFNSTLRWPLNDWTDPLWYRIIT